MSYSIELTNTETKFLFSKIRDILVEHNEHYGSYMFEELGRVSKLVNDYLVLHRGSYTVDVNFVTPLDAYRYLFHDDSISNSLEEDLLRFESTQLVYTSEEMWILLTHSMLVLNALTSSNIITITNLSYNPHYRTLLHMLQD